MTGQELYALYCKHQELLTRCTIDEWEGLTSSETRVWNAVAEEITQAALNGVREGFKQ